MEISGEWVCRWVDGLTGRLPDSLPYTGEAEQAIERRERKIESFINARALSCRQAVGIHDYPVKTGSLVAPG